MAYVYQEYPRTLHKAGGETLTIHNDGARDAALADGWALEPVINGAVIDFEEVATEAVEDVEKPKRGRPRKDSVN